MIFFEKIFGRGRCHLVNLLGFKAIDVEVFHDIDVAVL